MSEENLREKSSRLPAYLGALAALIGAMMPISAFINGRYSVEVEREKFLSQMRLNYLDRALDPSKDAAYRESITRYLLNSTEPSDPLYKWAHSQVALADEIRKLEQDIVILNADLKKAGAELARENEKRSSEASRASARERELQAQIADAEQKRARLEQALYDAEARFGRPSAVTHGAASVTPADDSKPTVLRADADLRGRPFGSAVLSVVGSGFGSKPGYLYVTRSPGGAEQGRLLEVSSWSDSVIISTIALPPNWEAREELRQVYIRVTTDDKRRSGQFRVDIFSHRLF